MKLSNVVSVNNAIAIAIEDMGGNINPNMIPVMIRWAIDADKEIGARNYYEPKKKAVRAEGAYLSIPCDAVFLKPYIVEGDYEKDDCCCEEAAHSCATGSDTAIIVTSSSEDFSLTHTSAGGVPINVYKRNVGYKVFNKQIRFNCSKHGRVFTIYYIGYKTDCDGYPMVRESNLPAITAYIKYMYAEWQRFNGDKAFTIGERRSLKDEYGRQVGKCIVAANHTTEDQNQSIRDMFNSPFYVPCQSDFMYIKDYKSIYND